MSVVRRGLGSVALMRVLSSATSSVGVETAALAGGLALVHVLAAVGEAGVGVALVGVS